MKIHAGLFAAPLVCAGSALFLVGCGGGASSPTVLSGAVIDGYIEGAKVCVDVNGNGACDADEHWTMTDASGRYRLDTRGMSAPVMNLVAEVSDAAKDADDGGRTLAAAGKSAYTLAAPVDKPSVITPLTTLIVGQMQTDNQSLAQATTQVLAQLGLPADTDAHADHVAMGNVLVGTAARQVASQLQDLQAAQGGGVSAADRWARIQQARQAQAQQLGTVSKPARALSAVPPELTKVATAQLFSYRMTSAKGKPIEASAMLFAPKSLSALQPRSLVVFGHGTVGVAPQCAPSVTTAATGDWEYDGLVALLVKQGYVVVAPDYEGLGSADMGESSGHPYLDLRSAGQSMALAAVAAKRILGNQLQGAWAVLGHSQGGHAALAGAQFSGLASQLEPSLSYKGAVAVAPASNVLFSLNAQWEGINSAVSPEAMTAAYAATGVLGTYGAYLVKGTQSTLHPIAADSVFGTRLLEEYSKLDAICRDDFGTAISVNVGSYAQTAGARPWIYAGLKINEINAPAVAQRIAANEPGQVKLPGKTLIVQGSEDTTVLPKATERLHESMRKLSSDVAISLQTASGATHSGVLGLSSAQSTMLLHLNSVFLNPPPGN